MYRYSCNIIFIQYIQSRSLEKESLHLTKNALQNNVYKNWLFNIIVINKITVYLDKRITQNCVEIRVTAKNVLYFLARLYCIYKSDYLNFFILSSSFLNIGCIMYGSSVQKSCVITKSSFIKSGLINVMANNICFL